jgi:hypothetical protein
LKKKYRHFRDCKRKVADLRPGSIEHPENVISSAHGIEINSSIKRGYLEVFPRGKNYKYVAVFHVTKES